MNAAARNAYDALMKARPDLFQTPDGGMPVLTDPTEIAAAECEVGARLQAEGKPAEWASVGVHYEDDYYMLLRDAVRFLDGSLGIHHRMMGKGGNPSGVAVLCEFEGRYLLLRHFRHATRQWHLEIPRGAPMQGLSLEETVRAELAEEAGAVVEEVVELSRVHTTTSLFAAPVAIFFARLKSIGRPAKEEGIGGLLMVSVKEFENLVRTGELADSMALAAFCLARLRGFISEG